MQKKRIEGGALEHEKQEAYDVCHFLEHHKKQLTKDCGRSIISMYQINVG